MVRRHYPVLAQISLSYSEPKGRFPRVTHPCATIPEGIVRLACVRHAASVRSEPGSNSQVDVTITTARDQKPRQPQHRTPGADTCTVKRNGYEGHATIGLIKLPYRARRPRPAGAVAHMSLHQNQQCQRPNQTNQSGQPSLPDFQDRGTRSSVHAGDQTVKPLQKAAVPSGEAPYMDHP